MAGNSVNSILRYFVVDESIGDVKALRAGLGYLGGIPVWRGGCGGPRSPHSGNSSKFFPGREAFPTLKERFGRFPETGKRACMESVLVYQSI